MNCSDFIFLRSALLAAVKTGSHPVEVVYTTPSSLALNPAGHHPYLDPSLTTLRIVHPPAGGWAVTPLQVDITFSGVSQVAAFKSHLQAQSVKCLDGPTTTGPGAADADARTLRVEWKANIDIRTIFDKLLSITCTL